MHISFQVRVTLCLHLLRRNYTESTVMHPDMLIATSPLYRIAILLRMPIDNRERRRPRPDPRSSQSWRRGASCARQSAGSRRNRFLLRLITCWRRISEMMARSSPIGDVDSTQNLVQRLPERNVELDDSESMTGWELALGHLERKGSKRRKTLPVCRGSSPNYSNWTLARKLSEVNVHCPSRSLLFTEASLYTWATDI